MGKLLTFGYLSDPDMIWSRKLEKSICRCLVNRLGHGHHFNDKVMICRRLEMKKRILKCCFMTLKSRVVTGKKCQMSDDDFELQ